MATGLPLPQVIYLKLNSYGIRFSASKGHHVLLLSGANKNPLSLVSTGENVDQTVSSIWISSLIGTEAKDCLPSRDGQPSGFFAFQKADLMI